MNRQNGKIYLIIFTIGILVLLAYDISTLYLQSLGSFKAVGMTRELISITIAIFMFLFHNKQINIENLKVDKALTVVIKGFILITVCYSIALVINQGDDFKIDKLLIRKDIETVIATTILSHGLIFFSIQIFIALQALIFYKRKRLTSAFYNIYRIVIFVGALLAVFFDEELPSYSILDLDVNLQSLFMIIATLLMVILSIRNTWITYLKRKEKYLFFIISSILTVLIIIGIDIHMVGEDAQNLATQSLFYAGLAIYLSLFFTMYISFSSLYILLHLPTARVFDRKMKEIHYLHNLSTAINSEPDFNKLTLMITNMANEVTESRAAWLEIFEEENERLYIASSKNLSSMEIKTASLSITEGLSGKVFFAKKAIVINNIEKNDEFRYLRFWKKDINSIVAVPLITTKNKILGIVYASKIYEHGFDPDDVAMLEAFSNQIVIALENSKLIKESIQRERLEQELKVARDVQQKLLPQELPEINKVDIDAIAFTANEVGGDYYDFIQKNESNFSVVVADVSGKGTSAAFYMAELKGIVKSLSTIYQSPKELMLHTNNVLNNHLDKKSFITAGMLNFDLENSDALHIRAGHCPLIQYCSEKNDVIYHTPKGIGLGLTQAKMFHTITEEQIIKIKTGDIFVLYTDGLNEARNIFEDEYGDDKIGEIVLENKSNTATDIKNAILDDVIAFAGKAKMHDDMTLAVVKIL